MYIGIAALVLAVSAYILKEGLPHSIITRIANTFGFVTSQSTQKRTTDGSERRPSIELDGVGNGDASYKSSIPSRKAKEEILIVKDDSEEDDGEKTPTSNVTIELSVPEVVEELNKLEDTPKEKDVKAKARKPRIYDDDEGLHVPMFPALNSAQRASKPSMPPPPSLSVPSLMGPPSLSVPGSSMAPPSLSPPGLSMPPPPVPNRRPAGASSAANARNAQYSGSSSSMSTLRVPQSSSSSLGVSRSLDVPQSNSSLAVPQQRGGSLQLPPTHSAPPPKPRQKVVLTPGHSPLDWANHQRSLPFVPLRRITPSELAQHGPRKNESKTYWTVLEGKVYDVTPYLPYHPGGDKEVLRVAGKDGTKLFNLTHPWVNFDNMLRGCEVGILVSENEMLTSDAEENSLESLD